MQTSITNKHIRDYMTEYKQLRLIEKRESKIQQKNRVRVEKYRKFVESQKRKDKLC